MKAIVQRVSRASVSVGSSIVSAVEKGLLVFLGVAHGDSQKDVLAMAKKICGLRIFEDSKGKMNLSVKDAGGEILAVSQFTLLADLSKGFRPSFSGAAHPDKAEGLYNMFISELKSTGIKIKEGKFRQHMGIELENDGPVTIIIDTKLLGKK